MGAAAGDDELVDFVLGEDEAVQGFGDAGGGEDGDGVDEIVRLQFEAADSRENFFDVGGAEVFAAGGFGRLEFEIPIAEEMGEKFAMEMALAGE